ncbi:hypothetical protein KIW84_056931 [Lathyrus oleraceus]|uniref:Reverse transcriptase domain-containing protein n=1 Tax=Pisum sativum TaxID=3888 RepID=A0A9D5AN68_PEA|nr:hypothetical protein KIW84_056931 [Pisum sativum]
MLDRKSLHGNLALKIDISKAFDTLDWSFLIKVLKQFGFYFTFCNWPNPHNSSLLSSQYLSMASCKVSFPVLGELGRVTLTHPSFFVLLKRCSTGANYNIDGSAIGSSGLAAFDGLFMSALGDYIGSFATNLEFQNSLYVELMGIILTIKLTSTRG